MQISLFKDILGINSIIKNILISSNQVEKSNMILFEKEMHTQAATS
jgi:hypothetical protein